ncbi:hypothetical protein [Legionella gresilensis]|uniref:hypothetical protein n=1 Tax=Legionella gresilensis TaxID=91823 RepID=UPI001040F6CB|nr:hypothetical protein [Legionella gresilensis]
MTNFTEHALLSFCSNSEVLNLSNQNVRDEDLIDVINFLISHPQIKTVNLSQNQIGAAGAKGFALHNTTATLVDLSWNRIGDVGAKDFALYNRITTAVDLSFNQIGNDGAKDFALHNKTATTVYLIGNQIGAVGAKDFAEHNTVATTVSLSGNLIGAVGAKDFALHNRTVTTVDLSLNKIGDEGAKGFALYNRTTTAVDLRVNQIGDVGMKALVSNLFLQKIEARGNYKLTRVGYLALNEKNPRKRACYGREVGLPSDVPSLLRLSIFSLKEKLIGDNQSQLRSFNKGDLQGLEDLVPLLNSNKI